MHESVNTEGKKKDVPALQDFQDALILFVFQCTLLLQITRMLLVVDISEKISGVHS